MMDQVYDWDAHVALLDDAPRYRDRYDDLFSDDAPKAKAMPPLPAVPAAKAEPMALLEERCTVINNALLELMERVYNWGADAIAFDGRLTCGTPMGKKGHKEYGLTPTEREVLRTHLLLRSRCPSARPWLYYNESTRAWYANVDARPVYESAVAWLMRNGIDPWFYNRAKEVANGSSG